jgi:hypothetical protein
MEKFVHQQNLALYRKLLAEERVDPERRRILSRLLADEEARAPQKVVRASHRANASD